MAKDKTSEKLDALGEQGMKWLYESLANVALVAWQVDSHNSRLNTLILVFSAMLELMVVTIDRIVNHEEV